jgi:hypothetical protein
MWTHALRATEIEADFVSFENLSRRRSPLKTQYDLVIVDEAHHVRSEATRRYNQLVQLSRRATILLLTATPIHNRRKDLLALLSLFLGSRAASLTQAEMARCVVRREHGLLKNTALIPAVLPIVAFDISDDPRVALDVMQLPDPVPLRGGGLGRSLIGRGLVHQWASSEAALTHALRRRIARAHALIVSLESGNYPTPGELRTWIFDDDALQLGFAELLSAPTDDADSLLEAVRAHSNALERLRASQSARTKLDIERADIVASVRAAHPESKIVAFAQYTETIAMLFRRLAKLGGVAMLTAEGARVSGGTLSRSEALSRFAPRALNVAPPARAEQINLLLSTDLLSEGVNLQDAQVVVHLDIPWTAARLEQRVGRVARMGSAHAFVYVYVIRPPASAAALIQNEALVQRKWDVAHRAIGSTGAAPFPKHASVENAGNESVTSQAERLRAILNNWRGPRTHIDCEMPVAAVSSSHAGFVAVVSLGAEPVLVVGVKGRTSTELASQILACDLASTVDVQANAEEYESARQELLEWAKRESASMVAGLADSVTLRRRRLVNRIDRAIESAAPHARSQRLVAATKARRVAAAQHSAAIETELGTLSTSQLPDDEWLAALAELEFDRAVRTERTGSKPEFEILALLLLSSST